MSNRKDGDECLQLCDQLSHGSFQSVVEVFEYLDSRPDNTQAFLDHLSKPACLDSDRGLLTVFEAGSFAMQQNVVFLLCLLGINPPFEIERGLRDVATAYFAEPVCDPIEMDAIESANDVISKRFSYEISSEVGTPGFYSEIEDLLIQHPDHAEDILTKEIEFGNSGAFAAHIKGFFTAERSEKAVDLFLKYRALQFVGSQGFIADRLTTDALRRALAFQCKPIVCQLTIPLLFGEDFTTHQFSLLCVLITDPHFTAQVIHEIFTELNPALQPPMSQRACEFIKKALAKASPIEQDVVPYIIRHLLSQLERGAPIGGILVLLLSRKIVTPDTPGVLEAIELLPPLEKMASKKFI